MYKYFNLISWIKNELLSQCRYNGFPSIPLKKRRKWRTDLVTLLVYIRASTSMGANFPSIMHKKPTFLFYTSNFTKHPHQSIYSTHLFNKIFILLPFFIIFFITSLSLSDLTTIIITTLIDKPFKVKPTQDQKPIQAETHFITHPIRNPLIKKRDISELIGSDLIRLRAAMV